MAFLIILLFLILAVILIKNKSKETNENSKTGLKNALLAILVFIGLFYVYAMAVGIISMIPLYFIERSINTDSASSGIWAYGLILAITISPILSLITTSRIINGKKENKHIVDVENEKLS